MSKLLSICIGTYNRADFLIQNLEVLLPQIYGYENKIELLISDNHSDDIEYNKLVSYLQNVQFPISFSRHEKNIGGEPNVFSVSDKAIGDYLFLLGDDDILSPNFLEIIIPYLETHKYSILHWNRLRGDAECNNNKLKREKYDGLIREINVLDFLKDISFDATFMSSVIISREAWEKGKSFVRDNHYGYKWFGRMIWGALQERKPLLWYYMPLVLHRNPSKVWLKDWPIYLMIGLPNIYKDIEKQYSGVYEYGIKWIHQFDIKSKIINMIPNRKYYLPYEEQFLCHLTADEASLLHYWFHVKHLKLVLFLEKIMIKTKGMTKIILNSYRNAGRQ